MMLGCAYAPTPLALCRETRPQQWLPNRQFEVYKETLSIIMLDIVDVFVDKNGACVYVNIMTKRNYEFF
ncbi:hypothetical protein NIES4071_71890 [Calothrix sp. NIES-4071]|nr:hypothetical protein NIES4071_71890 [Calothrix sp. NIES-4071]BAZ61464.1 hypothetical protein NIES4105_71840 [Calothrix sp. NIES-4105]